MKRFIKKLNFSHLKRTAQKGSGNLYVIAILGTIVAGSALMVGGLVPKLESPGPDAEPVAVDTQIEVSDGNTALELRSFGILEATPTPILPVCQTAAISILVDTSDSMAATENGISRIDDLKTALRSFVGNFDPDTVVSLLRFSGDAEVLVPFGTYQAQSSALASAINGLSNGSTTRMSLGFDLAKEKIEEAKVQFPDRRFYLVFMTDGLPEDSDCKYRIERDIYVRRDGVTRCTTVVNGKTVNTTIPTHPYNPTIIAQELQSAGIKVFSIPLYKDNYFSAGGEREVKKLFQRISSNPDETYLLRSPTSANLEQAYTSVAQNICPT